MVVVPEAVNGGRHDRMVFQQRCKIRRRRLRDDCQQQRAAVALHDRDQPAQGRGVLDSVVVAHKYARNETRITPNIHLLMQPPPRLGAFRDHLARYLVHAPASSRTLSTMSFNKLAA